ncbi:MAG: diguanylate cyclase [Deltaproteobacteria bacterium]|nr:diguanylate cyclase [Deltaproteobacteria bacterium]
MQHTIALTADLALICDGAGTVLEVVQSSAAFDTTTWKGMGFPSLVTESARDKAIEFIHRLKVRGVVFAADLQLAHGPGAMRFVGGMSGDTFLVVGLAGAAEPQSLFEAWVRASVEQGSAWRNMTESSVRGRVLRSDRGADLREDLLQELTRLNEELTSSQRSLAEHHAQLERAIAERDRRMRLMTLVQEATEDLSATLDADALPARAIDWALKAIPAARAAMLLERRPRSHRLEVRAARGFREDTLGMLLEETDPCVREALLAGRAFCAREGFGTSAAESAPSDFADARSVISAPLTGDPGGALLLLSDLAKAFDPDAEWFIDALCNPISSAWHNARVHVEMERLAVTDPLTGTYNRRGFNDLAKREFDRARRYGHPLGLILFDIDRFKLVNDTHGHAVGDQVLAEIGSTCRRFLRSSDIVARLGGDEFAILVVETDKAGAAVVAGRLRARIDQEPVQTDAGPIAVTVSVGSTVLDSGCKEFSTLIGRADEAMYEAKKAGRNRVAAWTAK